MPQNYQLATFAGGCFWCMEPQFSNIDGVVNVLSGYMGGHIENPTYEQVCSGKTGHIEVIQITYDPAKIDYATLLEVFWRNIDPFDPRGQFADKGSQYLAGIFTHDAQQQTLAEKSKTALAQLFNVPIASFIRPAETFYPAEEYHQQYFLKSAARYNHYAANNGRKQRLNEVWRDTPVPSLAS